MFEVKMNQVLNENERLLEQVINKDIVNIIVNSSVDNASVNVHECEKCLKLETELLNKKDFIEKETYDKLFRSYTTLEKHCISLEEKDLVITALKDELRKLKGKDLADNEQAAILREIVEQGKSQNPLNNSLDSACKYDGVLPYMSLLKGLKDYCPRLWSTDITSLNFGAINHLARHGLARGLLKIKFEKDHLCSAYAMEKSKKKPHKPKSEDINQEKLYLLHMDLCGPMRVASVNRKKYILIIVDDYSRFTWVKCLRSKDEALDFIIKFLKMIQLQLKAPV
ncbi:retrovirus-related pol polyprotein from transposon TNT 1-94 [Tanacetum coccineum]